MAARSNQKLSGVNRISILLYYSPALLVNAKAAFTVKDRPASADAGLRFGMTTIARLFQLGRIEIRKRSGSGVYTVNVAKAAEGIKNPQAFLNKEFQIQAIGQDGEVKLVDKTPVDATVFPQIHSASQIPGKKIVTIGIGGGSDGVQAAQVARALKADKQIAAVISVRTSKPTSQTANGQIAASRTIENHGGEIAPGVFLVLPTSTGSGRFLENLPAEVFPTYLVIDEQNGTLAARLRAALAHAGQPDTIVAVDTGGDALFSEKVEEGARATPDQDLRVLNTLAGLKEFKVLTAEVAVGVDSPNNAQDVLRNAGAAYWDLDAGMKAQILQSYRHWGMDGTDDNRYGKTPLSWQLALSNQNGLQTLNLPTQIVVERSNPWNPFVVIQDSMKGIFIMDLHRHLNAIGSRP